MPDIPAETLVEVAQAGGVAHVRLNRPAKLNAITPDMASRLLALADEISLDSSVRAVVLSGAGRSFCAGSDIKAVGDVPMDDAYRTRGLRPLQYCLFGLRLRQPVVVAIQGHCYGGGLELALHCDIRVAADDALLAAPEIKWGWLGGGGATQALPRLVGAGRTMKMLATGDEVDSATALAWGLVDETSADPLSRALALAHRIAERDPIVAQAAKRAVRLSMETGFSVGYEAELDIVWGTFVRPEREAGVHRFESRSSDNDEGRSL